MKKRATLIKMKNGRHRVATREEARLMTALKEEAQVSRTRRYLLERLTKELEPLRREFDINTELTNAIAAEYDAKSRPHIEAFIKAAEQRHHPCRFASLDKIIDPRKRIRRHTVHIHETYFSFDEDIR